MIKLKPTLRTTTFARLTRWILSSLLISQCFAANTPQIRTVPKSGSFYRVVATVKQKFYVKAYGIASNPKANPLTQPVSINGRWETTELAGQALGQLVSDLAGGGWTLGVISVDIGAAEVISGPDTNDYDSAYVKTLAVKSVAATNAQIARDAAEGWDFMEWLPKQPPECEVPGNSSSSSKPDWAKPLKITYTTNTEFSWTARWKEVKPPVP